MESMPGALRARFSAICLMVVKLAGAWSVRMRHSSSRKTMSMTQCRLFSTAQWLRTITARLLAGSPQRSDEEPRIPFDRATDLADAVADAVQAGPVVALLQPGDIVQDG